MTHRRFAPVLAALLALAAPAGLASGAPTPTPSPRPTATPKPVRAVVPIRVWVNLKTGVFHYPGQRWYGRTKSGQFMTADEARSAGYRPARNGQ